MSIGHATACSVQLGSPKTFAVVSAMGSHPTSPVKVTDLILNMISKAAKKDDGFLMDLNALEEKHMSTANELLGADTPEAQAELTEFSAQLLSDISDLKSMLKAIAIGGPLLPCCRICSPFCMPPAHSTPCSCSWACH